MSMGSKPLAHKFVRLLNVRLNLKAPWPLNSLARISAAGGTPWLPDRAEVIWMNHNPQAGREMKDHHPFLVLSPAPFHAAGGLVVGESCHHAQSLHDIRLSCSNINYDQLLIMTQARGAGTPQAIRLPPELLERIDRYAAHLEAELHLSVSRSDALRRLLSLALEDAEDTAEAEAILRANEPRVSWEELKTGSTTPAQALGS